jgi:hypothetical protein
VLSERKSLALLLGRLGVRAPLAQWQSSGLLIHWFGVRVPGGAPDFDLKLAFLSRLGRAKSGLLQQPALVRQLRCVGVQGFATLGGRNRVASDASL